VNLGGSLNQATKSHAIYGIETIGETEFREFWAVLHVSVSFPNDNLQNHSFLYYLIKQDMATINMVAK
jgi:hypothetical protein